MTSFGRGPRLSGLVRLNLSTERCRSRHATDAQGRATADGMTKKLMTQNTVPRRDAFTHSLGGMRTITSFTIAPAIADNQLHQVRGEQREPKPNAWFRWRRQPAYEVTATSGEPFKPRAAFVLDVLFRVSCSARLICFETF